MKKASARCAAAISLIVIYSLSVAQNERADPAHAWTYSGPHGAEHWGELDPAFAACANGKTQSPVDITHASASQLPKIKFDYRPSPLKIIDNGHTIQVTYASGSTIAVEGKTYELVQFHFHHPSEERIHGRPYDMVAHLVHKDIEGKLAVVAVLITAGKDNQLINTLWNNLPHNKGQELDLDNIKVNAADLLPTDQKYYTLIGSLTTPPCSEGVTWYVLKTPITLSHAQIETFAGIYPSNARLIQPLNGRIVRESK